MRQDRRSKWNGSKVIEPKNHIQHTNDLFNILHTSISMRTILLSAPSDSAFMLKVGFLWDMKMLMNYYVGLENFPKSIILEDCSERKENNKTIELYFYFSSELNRIQFTHNLTSREIQSAANKKENGLSIEWWTWIFLILKINWKSLKKSISIFEYSRLEHFSSLYWRLCIKKCLNHSFESNNNAIQNRWIISELVFILTTIYSNSSTIICVFCPLNAAFCTWMMYSDASIWLRFEHVRPLPFHFKIVYPIIPALACYFHPSIAQMRMPTNI